MTTHTVEMTDEQYGAWLKGQEAPAGTDAPSVHVTFLLDRSGSMESMHDDVVGGFNTFLEDQKAQPGDCRLTLVQFDNQSRDTVHAARPLADVPKMGRNDFRPRGGTPLLDAIGQTVAEVRVRAESHPGENQLVVILTDGQENQSREYTRAAIKSLIEDREKDGWTFAYLGCAADAYGDALSMGFSRGSTQAYAGDGAGMRAATRSLAANVSAHRSSVYAGVAPDPKNFYVNRDAEEDAAERGKAAAE